MLQLQNVLTLNNITNLYNVSVLNVFTYSLWVSTLFKVNAIFLWFQAKVLGNTPNLTNANDVQLTLCVLPLLFLHRTETLVSIQHWIRIRVGFDQSRVIILYSYIYYIFLLSSTLFISKLASQILFCRQIRLFRYHSNWQWSGIMYDQH